MPALGLTSRETQLILGGPKRLSIALSILKYAAQRPEGVTCDECLTVLAISHESGSTRFSELKRSGCLVATGQNRKTRSKGSAAVYSVPKNADFKKFLDLKRRKRVTPTPKSEGQRAVGLLSASEAFLKKWKATTSKEVRGNLVHKLVLDLIEADKGSH